MRYLDYYRDMKEVANQKDSTFVWYTLLELIVQGLLLLPPIATAGIVGVLTNNGSIYEILNLAMLYVIFYAIYTFFRMLVYRCYRNMAKKFHILLQEKLIGHIFNNDEIFSEYSRGKLIAVCTDDIRWPVDVIDCLAAAISRIIKIIITFVIFAFYNVNIAVVALLIDVIYILLMNKNNRKYSRHFDGSRKYEDKTTEIIGQMIPNLKQIKMMDAVESIKTKYRRFAGKWSEQYKLRRDDREKMYVHDEWMAILGRIILYVMMSVLVLDKKMTLETLVLLVAYFEQVITSTNEAWRDFLRPLSEYGVSTARIKKILNHTQKTDMEFGDFDNDYISGLVEFKNVSLERDGKKILKGISFKAKPNEVTVITGEKGSGKTSIINLLYRIEKRGRGKIMIDGEDVMNYSRRVYSSNVSGVFQKPLILNMSIKSNLDLVDADPKKQREVCKRVGLHKKIMQLKDGYDTVIADNEKVLSDGEKHLLAIARSVLTGAEVLILDEVSSEGGQAIPNLAKVIEDLKQDHTMIVISSDDEVLKMADNVLKMENGKIIKQKRK